MSPETQQRAGPSAEPLSMTVVRYRDRPDRCTLVPADAGADARLSRWLTVDRSLCVDCGAVR